jgi:hypothetical protein
MEKHDNSGTSLAARPTVWFAVAAIGIAVRLAIWWTTVGTNDVYTWMRHARNVAAHGVAQAYLHDRLFNHPPLIGLYAEMALRWSGGDVLAFARLIKLPGMVGEFLSLWLLWRFVGQQTLAAYAWLPCAVLVSAYHGNTDCLYAAAVLAAALAFDRRRYLAAGLLFGAALNVKLLPLALVPLWLIAAPDWRALRRFSAGALLALMTFLPVAVSAARPMHRNMILYNSDPDNWGLLVLFNEGPRIAALAPALDFLGDWYMALGRYVVLAAVTAVALDSRFRHKRSMVEQAALGAALFLILTPGFGVQYVVFAAPLICMVDLRFGIAWGWLSGAFIGMLYWLYLDPGPLIQSTFKPFPPQAWVVGLAAWALLIAFVWSRLRATSKLRTQTP